MEIDKIYKICYIKSTPQSVAQICLQCSFCYGKIVNQLPRTKSSHCSEGTHIYLSLIQYLHQSGLSPAYQIEAPLLGEPRVNIKVNQTLPVAQTIKGLVFGFRDRQRKPDAGHKTCVCVKSLPTRQSLGPDKITLLIMQHVINTWPVLRWLNLLKVEATFRQQLLNANYQKENLDEIKSSNVKSSGRWHPNKPAQS